jgi:hypothetical protein
MTDSGDPDVCAFCKQSKVTKHDEELAFHQWTNRGNVFCKVEIPMSTCKSCGSKSWDEAAEAIIQQSVSAAYDKLT